MAKKHVFLIYSPGDYSEVAKLRLELTAEGYVVWWERQILPGMDRKYAVREAMRDAYAVVVCFSEKIAQLDTRDFYTQLSDAIGAYRKCQPGSIFLIPVKLTPCDIPLMEIDDTRTLDQLQAVDLFPEEFYARALRTIVQSLHTNRETSRHSATIRGGGPPDHKAGAPDDARPPVEINAEQTNEAIRCFDDLFILLKTELREQRSRICERLKDAQEQLTDLRRYKELHERFHCIDVTKLKDLTSKVNELGLNRVVVHGRSSTETEQAWLTLKVEAEKFKIEGVSSLLSLANEDFTPTEVPWTVRLKNSSDDFLEAASDKDLDLLSIARQDLFEVLETTPVQVNTLLVNTARDLPLFKLEGELRHVITRLESCPLEGDARAGLDEIRGGCNSLRELQMSLDNLVNNHNCLQELQKQVQLHNLSKPVSVIAIRCAWKSFKGLRSNLQESRGEPWLTLIDDYAEKLEPSMSKGANQELLQEPFRYYCWHIQSAFRGMDDQLRAFCRQLDKLRKRILEGLEGKNDE